MRRRAGAPRLIEWTGERCVPWTPDIQVAYEHLHRYLWAACLVTGRRVLDLASGEGFGAAILAESAESVVGVDADEQTVTHSTLNYASDKIEFHVGDARDLSRFDSHSFGAVVAFEMIEHVEDQQRVLNEIARVLAPDGLVIMSTPDRHAYSEATDQENPFHVRELSCDEFVRLLKQTFEHTAIWGQRAITGSALSALDRSAGGGSPQAQAFFVEREGEDWQLASGLSPLYLVALASNAELPTVPQESTLGDCGLQLMRAAEAAAARSAEERVRAAREREQRRLRSAIADRDVEIGFLRKRIEELVTRAAEHDGAVDALQSELAVARRALWRVGRAVTWQLVPSVRGKLFYALGGERSPLVRAIQLAMRGGGRVFPRRRATAEPSGAIELQREGPIELPQFEHPEVSIIVPVHARAELTRACLASIRDNTSRVSYEVIVVDDGADEATEALLANVRGARIIVNDRNVGFLLSVNRGASEASGRWLVLCNNDIEVRDGWLSAMLDSGSDPDIGVVTPKYLYPDGSLNEAGGVIWRDGTGVNYGRGGNPNDCHYEFRREVDYGSAAALMVRTSFWRDVGGFDERFLPMYYEDTDLCFEARERGLRVIYEPRANVVHFEGATAGTDSRTGHKRHQELNRPKFAEKWRHRLEREHLRPGSRNLRRASNRNRGPHVLIVDHRMPTWDRDSGSLRMRGMLETLTELGCRLTFFPDNLHPVHPYTTELQRMGVEVWYGTVDISAELSAIRSGLALVIMSRPEPSSRWIDLIRKHAPSVPIVYDTVDLHWLREARRAAMAAQSGEAMIGPSAGTLSPLAVTLKEMELALIRATEATLVVSDDERRQIEADVPGAVVHVVPNVHELKSDVPPAVDRSGVLFIGGFEHPPNLEAAVRLVQRVMPQVWRELGEVPVTIVGGSVPAEVQQLASPLVEVTGWVQDVDPLIDAARALVAPMSYGAGLKGKVTQALAAGLPVVTTPIGAEGLPAVDGEHMLIGTDDAEVAERVVRVLTDADLWSKLSRAGQKLAEERCSPTVMAVRLSELLNTLGCTVPAAAALSAA
jgi:GT2 family glycosyltransferase/SAM-dependent methyltransferase